MACVTDGFGLLNPMFPTVTMLIQGPRRLFLFLSFYTFHCVFFKSSPFFPIFCSVDPNIVVLNLSFDWFRTRADPEN